jgi:hypothetical protein
MSSFGVVSKKNLQLSKKAKTSSHFLAMYWMRLNFSSNTLLKTACYNRQNIEGDTKNSSFLVILEFELRALCLLGRRSTTLATWPAPGKKF